MYDDCNREVTALFDMDKAKPMQTKKYIFPAYRQGFEQLKKMAAIFLVQHTHRCGWLASPASSGDSHNIASLSCRP